MDEARMSKFMEVDNTLLADINGGGFILGFMAGTIVGYVGATAIVICGGTQKECEQVLLSCIATGSALGLLTGPI